MELVYQQQQVYSDIKIDSDLNTRGEFIVISLSSDKKSIVSSTYSKDDIDMIPKWTGTSSSSISSQLLPTYYNESDQIVMMLLQAVEYQLY